MHPDEGRGRQLRRGEGAQPGRIIVKNLAENTEKSIDIWNRLISIEARGFSLTMGWESKVTLALLREVSRGRVFFPHHRTRCKVMANTSDKVKGEIHDAALKVKDVAHNVGEKVKDAAHNVAEKTKDVVHNVGTKIKDAGR